MRKKNPFLTFIFGLMAILAMLALFNFVINLKAMFQLRHAFASNSSPSSDFHQITQGMLSKAIAPFTWQETNLNGSDWFKLTAIKVTQNNEIVLGLSIIEMAIANFIYPIRQRRKLYRFVTIGFGILACSTLAVSFLSSSFGGF